MLLVGVVAELGLSLHVHGKSVAWLPWDLVAKLPLFDNVLPMRLSMFVSLVAAVAVASWAASNIAPRVLRVALPLLAVAAIVPSMWNTAWRQTPPEPPFFADGLYRSCLAPNENVLLLPLPHWTHAMIWQAQSDFAFRMAAGYISQQLPAGIPERKYIHHLAASNKPGSSPRPLLRYAKEMGATAIVVGSKNGSQWTRVFASLPKPAEVGNVLVYRLGGPAHPACGRSG